LLSFGCQETAELARRQAWYQVHQISMKKSDEQEYLSYCDDALFRIRILEQRLTRSAALYTTTRLLLLCSVVTTRLVMCRWPCSLYKLSQSACLRHLFRDPHSRPLSGKRSLSRPWSDTARPAALARRSRSGSLQASSDSSSVTERPSTTVSVGALHPGLQC